MRNVHDGYRSQNDDPGGGHDRSCLRCPRRHLALCRRECLYGRICFSRLPFCCRERRGHLRHCKSLLRPARPTPAGNPEWQAQLQYGASQVRYGRRHVLGNRRLHGRAVGGTRVGFSRPQFRFALVFIRPDPAAPHICGDLRVRRQCASRHLVLRCATHLPRTARRRDCAMVRRAWLQFFHCHCRHRLSARHHAIEGIRGARVVRGPVADSGVGHLSPHLSGDHHAAERAAYLRRQLVLSGLHRHHRDAASG